MDAPRWFPHGGEQAGYFSSRMNCCLTSWSRVRGLREESTVSYFFTFFQCFLHKKMCGCGQRDLGGPRRLLDFMN